MKSKDIEWITPINQNGLGYLFHIAHYRGYILDVSDMRQGNHFRWALKPGDSPIPIQSGQADTESEAKAAVTVAAWCDSNRVAWGDDQDYEDCMVLFIGEIVLGVGENGHWSVADALDSENVHAMSVENPGKSVPEAQLAAIISYEAWKHDL